MTALPRSAARAGRDAALVGLLACAARLGHAVFIARTPFFDGPVIDAYAYRRFAEQIAATGDFGGAFYQPPLYPAFLALLVRLGLGSPWAIAIAQSLLGAATAALLVPIGRALASDAGRARSVGLGAGIVTALYGPLVLFDLELLPPPVVDLALASAFALALSAARFGLADAVLGLSLGLCAIGFSLTALVAPGLLALRLWRVAPGRRVAALLVALLCAAPPLAWSALHNAAHDGGGVVVSFNTGINLWLGNNPRWRETWRARPGAQFEPEFERPDREGATTPAARSRFFIHLAVQDALARPGAALQRTAEKLYYALHGREIRRNQDIGTLREASPILRALLWEAGLCFPFGLLLPLALIGFARRRRETDIRILAGTALVYALGVALFFVASRYRLPLVLLLIPIAVDQALQSWTERARARGPLALLAAGVLLLNLPVEFTKTLAADAAERGVLEAQALRNGGQIARAERLAAALVARFPHDANVQMLHAELLAHADRCREAEPHLRAVIALAPRAATPRVALGTCYDDLGDPAAAERAFAGALSLHPYHPVALKRAGALYARHGRQVEARALLERFVASGYDDVEVARALARSREEPGR